MHKVSGGGAKEHLNYGDANIVSRAYKIAIDIK